MAEAKEKEEVVVEEEGDVPKYEELWNDINSRTEELLNTMASFSDRTFFDAANYKARQNLEKTDYGKREFRNVGTAVRKVRTEMKRKFNEIKPREPQERKSTGKTGFNRLVLVDEDIRGFMKLSDWGLIGEADPDRVGVCTHAIVTRVFSNYVSTMQLLNPLKTSTWKADDRLRKIFAKDWEELGINPDSVKYTELQKLIARHITTVKKGMAEHRKEADYRKKLDDDGEYGKATMEVRDLRQSIDELAKAIRKHNDFLITCREEAPKLAPAYEKALKELVAQFDTKATEIKKKCAEYDFPIADNYPTRPKTVL